MHIRFAYPSLLICLLALSLSACLSMHKPGQVARYNLPEVPLHNVNKPAAPVLVLPAVKLADYLDSDRIILQMDDVTLRPTRDHLWADSLSQQIERGLRNRLSLRLPDTRISTPQAQTMQAPQLRITIDQFQGHMQGYAVLSGQWQLPPQHSVQHFRFTVALTESGYPALVRALGQTLDQLADSIAQQLNASNPS